MSNQSKHNLFFWTLAFLFALSIVGVCFYFFKINPPIDDPRHMGNFRFLTFIAIASAIFFFCGVRWEGTRRLLKQYFSAIDHPINLAIFRIALFWYVLTAFDFSQILCCCRLPKEFLFPPMGLEWIAHHCPMQPPFVNESIMLFKILCIMALVGIFSRFSIVAATILFLYVGMIPQCFGKVDHYHNLFWFMTILSVSPCSDYLSIDSIRQAFRNADRGIIKPPEASRLYGLPIRFIWLLFGVAYFGPGFWKLWNNGLAWVFGDNFKYLMYAKWMNFDNWVPVFRLDHYPWLYHVGGLLTIFFEMGFIVLILFPFWRWVVISIGYGFHLLTIIFFQINFSNLKNLYVVFLPWDKIGRWAGRKIFKTKLRLFYDGNCGICRRTLGALQRFDFFQAIEYINALDKESQKDLTSLNISIEMAMHDIHAVAETKIWRGYNAYRKLSWRLPIFWPILPFMYIWPVTAIGRGIYRKVADSRACQLIQKPLTKEQKPATVRPILWVGSFLIIVNLIFAINDWGNAWPFACYPTFSNLASKQAGALEVEVVFNDGTTKILKNNKFYHHLPPQCLSALIMKIMYENKAKRPERLAAFWKVMVKDAPELEKAKEVHFYELQNSTIPEEKSKNPLSRKLIYQMNITKTGE